MSQSVEAHGLQFRPYLSADVIRERVEELGCSLHQFYRDKNPLFLGVLNGAFVFTADLVRASQVNCEISFIKLSSYDGLGSTGQISNLIGLEEPIEGRHLILVEDIIDTGQTLHHYLPLLRALQPASLAVVTLLLKPEDLQHQIQIDYVGFEIPPKFVIGYGLDYRGLGRHLPGIYQLAE